MLLLLLDSVPDLTPIASGGADFTEDEVETTRNAFRELKTYCKEQLSDLQRHFDLDGADMVTVLSKLYAHTAIVPSEGESWADTRLDPEEAITEAIAESVNKYYGRCKEEAEHDSDDEYEEDEESKFLKLTLLAEQLDLDLDKREFSTLLRCVEYPEPTDSGPGDDEAGDGGAERKAKDPVDIGLQKLIERARIDCAVVIAGASVDKSMAPCMIAMRQLDERLIELRQETWVGEQELEDGVDPPESLLRLDALTAPIVGPWLEEQTQSWAEWVNRSLEKEDWTEPKDPTMVDGVPVATSAVDVYSIITAAVNNFEESGMHKGTSDKLRKKFALAVVSTVEMYVNALEKSLGHMPRIEGSSKGKPAAPGRTKLNKKVPQKERDGLSFKGTIEIYLRTVTVDEIIMRLNSLHYMQKQVLESSETRAAAARARAEVCLPNPRASLLPRMTVSCPGPLGGRSQAAGLRYIEEDVSPAFGAMFEMPPHVAFAPCRRACHNRQTWVGAGDATPWHHRRRRRSRCFVSS